MTKAIEFDDGATVNTGSAQTLGAQLGDRIELLDLIFVVGDGYLVPAELEREAHLRLGYRLNAGPQAGSAELEF